MPAQPRTKNLHRVLGLMTQRPVGGERRLALFLPWLVIYPDTRGRGGAQEEMVSQLRVQGIVRVFSWASPSENIRNLLLQ